MLFIFVSLVLTIYFNFMLPENSMACGLLHVHTNWNCTWLCLWWIGEALSTMSMVDISEMLFGFLLYPLEYHIVV